MGQNEELLFHLGNRFLAFSSRYARIRVRTEALISTDMNIWIVRFFKQLVRTWTIFSAWFFGMILLKNSKVKCIVITSDLVAFTAVFRYESRAPRQCFSFWYKDTFMKFTFSQYFGVWSCIVVSYSSVNERITGSFGDLTVTFHPQNVDGTYQEAIHSCQGTFKDKILFTRLVSENPYAVIRQQR